MNKYQDSLDELCSRCYVESELCTCHPRYKGGKCNNNCEHKQILQELVDKETPMKVDKNTKGSFPNYDKDDTYHTTYKCPKCNCTIHLDWHEERNFCSECGVKLDWGDDND